VVFLTLDAVLARETGEHLGVRSFLDPLLAKRREALRDIDLFRGVTEVTRRIVDKDRGILFGFPFGEAGILERDFPHRDLDIGARPLNIDAAARGQGIKPRHQALIRPRVAGVFCNFNLPAIHSS